MMIYKEIKSKTVYGAKRSRVTRALETMQCRKAGIINLSTKEETDSCTASISKRSFAYELEQHCSTSGL